MIPEGSEQKGLSWKDPVVLTYIAMGNAFSTTRGLCFSIFQPATL